MNLKSHLTVEKKNTIEQEYIEVYGAREHNLKNFDVKIPRQKLVVITGVSGSGKSSLAFDTIYAEGQRRYMESFSAYARSFIGNMKRPDVDKIEGLSPVISIEQKTTSRNPRSTVGTTTEIYDFLRLLFARAGIAYSYKTGERMIKQSEDQIISLILEHYSNQKINILAPVVRARKGHYRELFAQIRKSGYLKVRVDGEIIDITPSLQLDRYKTHDIEIVIDRIKVQEKDEDRIRQSIKQALKQGNGVLAIVNQDNELKFYSKHLMCPTTGISYDEPAPNLFSFNSPYGACEQCNGLGKIEEFTQNSIIPNDELSIADGGIAAIGKQRNIQIFKEIESVLAQFDEKITTPIKDLKHKALETVLHGGEYEHLVKSSGGTFVPYFDDFEGVIPFMTRHFKKGTGSAQKSYKDYLHSKTCPSCNGARLKEQALFFKIHDKNIAEISQMDIEQLSIWFGELDQHLEEKQQVIAEEILKEINKRIKFLVDVGLTYLSLDRSLRTLSGGEAQRIRLATQIGTQLVGVTYILDEPSIGLHQRDNVKLINALQDLRDLGNTVLVVEHDKDMMLASDYVLDIGPKAGRFGGQVVSSGNPQSIIKENNSTTAQYLSENVQIKVPTERREGNGNFLILHNAHGNNLKNVTLTLPLGKLISITGVSGSGKSTLIHNTLHPILSQHFYRSKKDPLAYDKIEGLEHIDKVIEVDQSPIGRTPRSNPATYTGVFTEIRNLFTQVPEAKIRGYKSGRFSFNVKGGRCETCEGGGLKLIEMDFLPDVYVECETCKGKRYNRETLEIRWRGKSISDVLDMTVNDAVKFFENQPRIIRKIQALQDVGLGYITLGQHATTLSGGEAQRVKLATELAKKDTGKTLYILDEPTTGLHFQDIQQLLNVVHKLVDKGNTIIIIEHNLDVVKVSDHVIDIGLEGGKNGGIILTEGTPEEVAKHPTSYTAKFLKQELLQK
ncbi:MAG: excinuclease ABC subunit UvrA [Cytophagales bacterium]|nr:excinuclease ABC subunit UvrA [Cytophagales bacterium]